MRLARLLPLVLLAVPALAWARPDVPESPGAPYALVSLTAIPSVFATTDEAGPGDGSRRFTLGPATPNPFRSSTRLTLTVDASQRLTVAVFDALGRRVALLADGVVAPGSYPLTFDASGLPAGLYVVRVTDGQGTTSTRAVALSR